MKRSQVCPKDITFRYYQSPTLLAQLDSIRPDEEKALPFSFLTREFIEKPSHALFLIAAPTYAPDYFVNTLGGLKLVYNPLRQGWVLAWVEIHPDFKRRGLYTLLLEKLNRTACKNVTIYGSEPTQEGAKININDRTSQLLSNLKYIHPYRSYDLGSTSDCPTLTQEPIY